MLTLLLALCVGAEPTPGALAFPMPPVKAAGTFVDLSGLNPAPAGSRGPVTVQNGQFIDGAGQRLRLLGTNLTFATAFPDKSMSPLIAQRMAQLGFNVVRLHHLDNAGIPRGLWGDDTQTSLDAEQMDRLDWLIYNLKQAGIYVNLNLHVSRWYTGFDWAGVPRTYNYGKSLDNYHPEMIRQQHEYARLILEHVNPYTGASYAAEPAISFVELNNENSLTGQATNPAWLELSDEFVAPLRQQWGEFIAAKYGDLAAALNAWQTVPAGFGPQMLTNGDFTDGLTRWTLEAPAPAQIAGSVVESDDGTPALRTEMTALGTESWHFQVHQVGLNLTEGQVYTVEFQARANEARPITAGARRDIDDWRHIGGTHSFTLTPEWQDYRYTFLADDVLPDHTRITFGMGNRLGWVEVRRVTLREGAPPLMPPGAQLDQMPLPLPLSTWSSVQAADIREFLVGVEDKYVGDLTALVQEIAGGSKLVIDSQADYGGTHGLLREVNHGDFIDMHAYWQHPVFPGTAWDGNNWYISNTPMVASTTAGTMQNLSGYRAAGKPHTISEYDHPAPSFYSAEMMPLLAAVAGLQDWDGLYQFDYGDTTVAPDPRITGYFTMVNHPAKVALSPFAAVLFRGGSMPAAAGVQRLMLPRSVAMEGGSVHNHWRSLGLTPFDVVLRARSEVQLTDGGELGLVEQDIAPSTALVWEPAPAEQAHALIDTPQAAAVLGMIQGRTLSAGPLAVTLRESVHGFATVAVNALDGRPLDQSERLLLAVVGAVANTGMEWNDTSTSVGNRWGSGPTRIEPLTADLSLSLGDGWRMRALDGHGVPGAEVPLTATADGFRVTVDPGQGTLWYALDKP